MSQLKIKLNLSTRQWITEEVDISADYIDILFGFIDRTPLIEFKNLSFGLILLKDNSIIHHATFPRVGSTYKSTNSEFVELIRVESLLGNARYDLMLWVDNDQVRAETTYVLNTPDNPKFTDYEVI